MLMKKNTKSVKVDNVRVFRLMDFIVIIISLFTAVFSINMFGNDLTRTINLKNVEPVGVVIIKKNIVQRRLMDRVLWDRLAAESFVYMGDLIRVAELSAATIYVDGSNIELNENTLIRLMRAADGESLQILLDEGNLSLSTSQDQKEVSLDIYGHQIMTGAGTMLNVKSTENRIRVQVNEGTARFIENGVVQEVNTGGIISLTVQLDPSELSEPQERLRSVSGFVREEKSAVILNPIPNARFVNNNHYAYSVNFLWNRINFRDDELLKLEISADRNFRNVFHVQDNLINIANTVLDNGQWYWRLLFNNTIHDEGGFAIIDGTGARLKNPITSSVYRFTDINSIVNFQWEEVEQAISYILEVSGSSDFSSVKIRRQCDVPFFAESGLGEGTWYWRVMPLFPSVFIGSPSFSQASYFINEKIITSTVIERTTITEWFMAELPPELIEANASAAPNIKLLTPANGSRVEGLTALRQQTIFTWECDMEIVSSRLVISRNADPFTERPAIEIQNPGSSVFVNRMETGTWYWNIEVQSANGSTVRAPEHSVLQITAIPNLPAVQNLQPARGRRYTMSDLQTQRSINFLWQAVRGANAYILTIFQQTDIGRRQIFQTQPLNSSDYSLDNLRILDNGTFFWQVEAVNRRAIGGAIDQRGNISESSFVIDIIVQNIIEIEGSGVHIEN